MASVLVHPRLLSEPHRAAEEVASVRGRKATAANGAVMRTAVAGVPFFWDAARVRRNTLDICAVTHADGRCKLSCLLMTAAVSRILNGEKLSPGMFARILEDELSACRVQERNAPGPTTPVTAATTAGTAARFSMTLPRTRYGLGFGLCRRPDGHYTVDRLDPEGPACQMGLEVGDVVKA